MLSNTHAHTNRDTHRHVCVCVCVCVCVNLISVCKKSPNVRLLDIAGQSITHIYSHTKSIYLSI